MEYLNIMVGPTYTNLVQNAEILLPIKFCQILFGCRREEVQNVPAYQGQGLQPLSLLDNVVDVLASYQVLLISR